MENIKSILDEAKELTSGERLDEYGHPNMVFNLTAKLWTAYLQEELGRFEEIQSKDVTILMTLFKLAREKRSPKRDNLVDAAGYIRLAAVLEGIEEI